MNSEPKNTLKRKNRIIVFIKNTAELFSGI